MVTCGAGERPALFNHDSRYVENMNEFKINPVLYCYIFGTIGIFYGFELKTAVGIAGIILLCNAFLLALLKD